MNSTSSTLPSHSLSSPLLWLMAAATGLADRGHSVTCTWAGLLGIVIGWFGLKHETARP